MKEGSSVLHFRDYARYDQKEIRFATRGESKLEDHAYVRQDGTLAVYFDQKILLSQMARYHLFPIKCETLQRRFTNRKTGVVLDRCMISGTFTKNYGSRIL